MKSTEARLLLTTSPFLKQVEDTPTIMRRHLCVAAGGVCGNLLF
ncbi:MAG: hypothetical protein R3C26_13780 [Calditrichia bacterium]